jgi:bifunctional non-homologous end joining protein LigD
MSLTVYKKKRNFKSSKEPSGKKESSKSKLVFVVQRHKASHLHYDFRLEMEGVLKSWAVPKGPSLNPNDKRLAMMVEDHPYNYRTFEGVIPEGNYGAGIVEIWDEGTYEDLEGLDKKAAEKSLLSQLKKGSLKFTMHGKKLKGEFALVKLKGPATGSGQAKQDNAWLLIKHKDKYATAEEYNSEEQTRKSSPINKWLKEHSKNGAAKKTVIKTSKASVSVNASSNEVKKKSATYRALPKS